MKDTRKFMTKYSFIVLRGFTKGFAWNSCLSPKKRIRISNWNFDDNLEPILKDDIGNLRKIPTHHKTKVGLLQKYLMRITIGKTTHIKHQIE